MGKLEDSQAILAAFGLPAEQQNEAACYTLLALAGLREDQSWKETGQATVRIHDILLFLDSTYGKRYAENTRETIRRRVLHQFTDAFLAVRNPDNPARPTNSGKTCYALTNEAHGILAAFGSKKFASLLAAFHARHPVLAEAYQAARRQHSVEVEMPDGVKAFLSPGSHNVLQAAVIRELWPRFLSTAKLLYLGDTAKKDWHVDAEGLHIVGLPYYSHDKFPDLVFWMEDRQWLILVEAVISHGPVSPKRRSELEELLMDSPCRRIYVTAFATHADFKRHLAEIAWETEVWLSETPEHMIHFNGPKFLAPLPDKDESS